MELSLHTFSLHFHLLFTPIHCLSPQLQLLQGCVLFYSRWDTSLCILLLIHKTFCHSLIASESHSENIWFQSIPLQPLPTAPNQTHKRLPMEPCLEPAPRLQRRTGLSALWADQAMGNFSELPATRIMSCAHLITRDWIRASNLFHMGQSAAQDRNKFESMQSKGENLH